MTNPLATRPIDPFGVEVVADLSGPLDTAGQEALRALVAEHKLVLVRNQRLSEDDQVRILSYLGNVLGGDGDYREISSDGNLGIGPLGYHSDLGFTDAPFKLISLHALEVNDGQSWTRFANGVRVLDDMDAELRAAIEGREARNVIGLIQSHRAVAYNNPPSLPQKLRPAIISHPTTNEPVLYISELLTSRIEGLPQPESDALLARLFDALYAPGNVYEHRWNNGDFIIWDNIALAHARCDLTGMTPRRLQRVTVAEKSFFELCPQFDLENLALASRGALLPVGRGAGRLLNGEDRVALDRAIIDEAKIFVADLDAMDRFYARVLGLKRVARSDFANDGPLAQKESILSMTGRAEGPQLQLVGDMDGPASAFGEAGIGFIVDDVDASTRAATTAGGSLVSPVQDVPEHRLRAGIVTDPEGNIIELLQQTG